MHAVPLHPWMPILVQWAHPSPCVRDMQCCQCCRKLYTELAKAAVEADNQSLYLQQIESMEPAIRCAILCLQPVIRVHEAGYQVRSAQLRPVPSRHSRIPTSS